jgi:hypothetical protein
MASITVNVQVRQPDGTLTPRNPDGSYQLVTVAVGDPSNVTEVEQALAAELGPGSWFTIVPRLDGRSPFSDGAYDSGLAGIAV